MNTITRLGTFDNVVKGSPNDVSEICWALRSLISELHPDCVEVPRPGEPSAAYGYGEKKMSEAYAYIMPQKTYANLGSVSTTGQISNLNIRPSKVRERNSDTSMCKI